MKFSHAALKKPKKISINVENKFLLKIKRSKQKICRKKLHEDEKSELDFEFEEEDKYQKLFQFKLETIREESIEALRKEEDDFEKTTSELINLIEDEKEFINRSIEEYLFDLTESTAEEELEKLRMALFDCKDNSDLVDEPGENIDENVPVFEEYKVYSNTGVEIVESEEISGRVEEKLPDENVMGLAEKTSSTLTFVISNVQLEGKPSSTNISVAEVGSDSFSSFDTQSEVRLLDFIAKKSTNSTNSTVEFPHQKPMKTYDLTSDFRQLCRYLFRQIRQFLESPLAVYFVIFIASVYITLSSVFYDTLNGAELVWNIFPGNRPAPSGFFSKKIISRFLFWKL